MDQPSRPTVDVAARCACGAVSVRLAGRVLSMFMCACEDCQRSTGAGHSAFILARADDVTIEGDVRAFASVADSGATFTRHFCPSCGTPIYGQSSRATATMALPVGLFGGKAPWYVPNQLIFARSHRDWDTLPPGLPQHATYRAREH
jgi:hypothetical protein